MEAPRNTPFTVFPRAGYSALNALSWGTALRSARGVNKTSVHVVLPCLNEERALRASVETLLAFLAKQAPRWDSTITVVDNGSEDATMAIAQELAAAHPGVVLAIQEPARGRGRALRAAWEGNNASVQCYMDVDLSTGLETFPAMVDAVAGGECDLAAGSRVAPGASVQGRSWLRSLTSAGMVAAVRLLFFRSGIRDAQCGCKAVSRELVRVALPKLRSRAWFFDTELLLTAAGAGYKVKEVGVTWVDDRDSRVRVLATVLEMVRGLMRLRVFGWRNRIEARNGAPPRRSLMAKAACIYGVATRAAFRITRATLLLPLLHAANRIVEMVARMLPGARSRRINNERLVRAGFFTKIGLGRFKNQIPGFAYGMERLTRFVLNRLDDDTLFGITAISAGEIISRETQRQIDPLPVHVQERAYSLIDKVVEQLEGKVVELGEMQWSLELFLNKELRVFVSDPWNSIPILREPGAKETIALVLQSLVQLEAKKVLEAMGLTERQQRLFLELNRTLSSPALVLEAQATSPQDGRNFYEKIFRTDLNSALKRFDRDGDGVISWEELYKVVALKSTGPETVGEQSPDGLRKSFLLLDMFQSGAVPLSPQLNLLLEVAKEQGKGGNATARVTQRLEEELVRSISRVDSLFVDTVDKVQSKVGESMIQVFYTADGKPIPRDEDHLLGGFERRLALPVFEGAFRGILAVRNIWADGVTLLQGQVGKISAWEANSTTAKKSRNVANSTDAEASSDVAGREGGLEGGGGGDGKT